MIGGDGLSLSIAAASIVAKVIRDRLMQRLAARWPGYGWEHNAGYATPEHRQALTRLGATIHHRRGFVPVSAVIGQASLDLAEVAAVDDAISLGAEAFAG